MRVLPKVGVWVEPNAGVAAFANVLPKGAAPVVPNPVVCPNPVVPVGWPKSGLLWPNRLEFWEEAGVEKEKPVDWGVPKVVVDWAGFPKSEVLWNIVWQMSIIYN